MSKYKVGDVVLVKAEMRGYDLHRCVFLGVHAGADETVPIKVSGDDMIVGLASNYESSIAPTFDCEKCVHRDVCVYKLGGDDIGIANDCGGKNYEERSGA